MGHSQWEFGSPSFYCFFIKQNMRIGGRDWDEGMPPKGVFFFISKRDVHAVVLQGHRHYF